MRPLFGTPIDSPTPLCRCGWRAIMSDDGQNPGPRPWNPLNFEISAADELTIAIAPFGKAPREETRGHFLVSDAIFIGVEAVIRKMRPAMEAGKAAG